MSGLKLGCTNLPMEEFWSSCKGSEGVVGCMAGPGCPPSGRGVAHAAHGAILHLGWATALQQPSHGTPMARPWPPSSRAMALWRPGHGPPAGRPQPWQPGHSASGNGHPLVTGGRDSPHMWAGAVRGQDRFASSQLQVAPLWRRVLQWLSAALEQAGTWFFVSAPGKLEPWFVCVSHHCHRNVHVNSQWLFLVRFAFQLCKSLDQHS